jgi:hypothetical protein
MQITKETTIEEIVHQSAPGVRYLREKGTTCIACGEPVWGTLEEAAREKGFDDAAIEGFVKELRENY